MLARQDSVPGAASHLHCLPRAPSYTEGSHGHGSNVGGSFVAAHLVPLPCSDSEGEDEPVHGVTCVDSIERELYHLSLKQLCDLHSKLTALRGRVEQAMAHKLGQSRKD